MENVNLLISEEAQQDTTGPAPCLLSAAAGTPSIQGRGFGHTELAEAAIAGRRPLGSCWFARTKLRL